ncbi:MAG: Fe-S protein assembly co-chaperone HscB [Pseudomonadota bacterium]
MLDLSKNYFELFGMPVGYVIDIQKVQKRYRDLQRVVHPDRYVNATEQEQRLALQGAAYINEAFETLKDPLRRAQYLLTLHDVDFDPETETTTDTGFLMEQLELREELSEIPRQAEPLEAATRFMERVSTMFNRLISSIAIDFEMPDAKQLEEAREKVRKMQFLKKLHAEAEAAEARLEEEAML